MRIQEVEKNIPFPEVVSKHKYLWPDMEVGDSVLIQVEKGESLHKLKRKVWSASNYYGKKTGKKFKTMLMHEESGVRVWRLK
jgi:hypothetical protein